jgi:hypothetical protein
MPFAALRSMLQTFTIHRDDSALLRDWGRSRVPVYFDFGEAEQRDSPLWRLYPVGGVLAYVSPVVRAEFVKAHREGCCCERPLQVLQGEHPLTATTVHLVIASLREAMSGQSSPELDKLNTPDYAKRSTSILEQLPMRTRAGCALSQS